MVAKGKKRHHHDDCASLMAWAMSDKTVNNNECGSNEKHDMSWMLAHGKTINKAARKRKQFNAEK